MGTKGRSFQLCVRCTKTVLSQPRFEKWQKCNNGANYFKVHSRPQFSFLWKSYLKALGTFVFKSFLLIKNNVITPQSCALFIVESINTNPQTQRLALMDGILVLYLKTWSLFTILVFRCLYFPLLQLSHFCRNHLSIIVNLKKYPCKSLQLHTFIILSSNFA